MSIMVLKDPIPWTKIQRTGNDKVRQGNDGRRPATGSYVINLS